MVGSISHAKGPLIRKSPKAAGSQIALFPLLLSSNSHPNRGMAVKSESVALSAMRLKESNQGSKTKRNAAIKAPPRPMLLRSVHAARTSPGAGGGGNEACPEGIAASGQEEEAALERKEKRAYRCTLIGEPACFKQAVGVGQPSGPDLRCLPR